MKSTQKPDIKALLESNNIANISMHTDNLEEGSAFCVTKYMKEYVDLALTKGAKFIVSEENIPDLPEEILNIIVPNIKEFITEACIILYPQKPKYMVGVTGTSGKTSIVDYYRQICTHLGLKSASLGTMGVICSDKNIEANISAQYQSSLTTADQVTFHKILNHLAKEGVDYVAFEVSSHALHQDRIGGIILNVAIFSNLSQDHLDYHKTMDEYKRAKLKIFTKYLAKEGVGIVSDKLLADEEVRDVLEGRRTIILREVQSSDRQDLASVYEEPCTHNSSRAFAGKSVGTPGGKPSPLNEQLSLPCEIPTVSALHLPQDDGDLQSDIVITNLTTNATSQDIEFTYASAEYKTTLNMMGSFQSTNALMALASVVSCNVDAKDAANILDKLHPVAGRLQTVTDNTHPFTILVDYAHKPEAIESCLKELKNICDNRLIILFGCGGNRDSSKRKIMGEIAQKYADIVIVTDDNPRFEDPASIRKDVMEGAIGAIEIEDRAKAIKAAIAMLEKGDILLLAGKGHEDYQIIGDKKIHLDDSEEVRKNL